MQFCLHGFDLFGRQASTVAPKAMIQEGSQSALLVSAYPVGQSAGCAPTDVLDQGCRVASSVEAHGLIACLGRGVLAMLVSGL